MQIPILNGIYTDEASDFRTSYPRNMVPVPKAQGISQGYLRPADGIIEHGTGPGIGRGGFNWNNQLYRVMGTKLVRIAEDGSMTTLGDVGSGGQVTMDNGFDRLAIWSGTRLYYWDGTTLTQVTDPDLGNVIDGRWIAGYYLSTDGTSIIATDLNDPLSVNPLKYGSAEADPDPINAIDELHNEAYALGRYTIEAFENIGGNGFPFQRIDGALVRKGIIGTHAYAEFAGTFAFVGGGKNNGASEPPSVYLMAPGDAVSISTREIDTILQGYTEDELALCVVETRSDKAHQHLLIHLPDQCLVYDLAASKAVGEPVWFTLTSSIVGIGTYRARNLVWCYNTWNVEDPTTAKIGTLTDTISTHYGDTIGWDFSTQILYAESRDAIIFELELIALTGRVALGIDPTIWTSYSLDGETWSVERPKSAGKQGDRRKRLAWRDQGQIKLWRIQKFRGTSDAHISFARLEAQLEPLFTKP